MVAVTKKNISRKKSQRGGMKILKPTTDPISKNPFRYLSALGTGVVSLGTSPAYYVGTKIGQSVKQNWYANAVKDSGRKLTRSLIAANPDLLKGLSSEKQAEYIRNAANTKWYKINPLRKKRLREAENVAIKNLLSENNKERFDKAKKNNGHYWTTSGTKDKLRALRTTALMSAIDQRKLDSNTSLKRRDIVDTAIKILEEKKTKPQGNLSIIEQNSLNKLYVEKEELKNKILTDKQLKEINSYKEKSRKFSNIILKREHNTASQLIFGRIKKDVTDAFDSKNPFKFLSPATRILGINAIGKLMTPNYTTKSTDNITKLHNVRLQKAKLITDNISNLKNAHDDFLLQIIDINQKKNKPNAANDAAINKYIEYNKSINDRLVLSDKLRTLQNKLAITSQQTVEWSKINNQVKETQAQYDKAVSNVVANLNIFNTYIDNSLTLPDGTKGKKGTKVKLDSQIKTQFESLLKQSNEINNLVLEKQDLLTKAADEYGNIINKRIKAAGMIVDNERIKIDSDLAINSILDNTPFNGTYYKRPINDYKAELNKIINLKAENVTQKDLNDQIIEKSVDFANNIVKKINETTDPIKKTQYTALYKRLVDKNTQFLQVKNL